MTIMILKIMVVGVLLATMFIMLVCIGHLFSGRFDTRNSDVEKLRRDVRERDEIMTSGNAFHAFLSDSSNRRRKGSEVADKKL